MSRRWTFTLLCVILAITMISASGEDHASLSNDDVTAAAVAAATGGAAAAASQSQPVKSDESAPHVQAVNVAKQYNDKYDEDEDQDDDFFLIPPPPPKPTQVTPPKEHKSIDERIAAQKFKIQQLQEQLSAQREKHAAAATLIAKRNKEIEKRMRKHAAEMTKAADIQRRRDALDRAEKAEKARKAAAKRAAEIRAQQQVYALQKLLAQQSEAATLAERTLARQQQEDAIRKRVIASQHETYQQLEAELRAHEAEFGKHHHHHHHRLRELKHRIQYMPFRTHPRHHHGRRHGRLSRRVTFTPRLSSNPFLHITPNPSWIPRRRLLGIRLRRWIIIQSIRARRAVPPPTTVPTITIARLQYQQARATARATLRAIITRRVVQKRAALAAFRKFSQQLAITVTLARSALIHHKSHHHRHRHRHHGHRYGHRHGRHHGRRHGYRHGHRHGHRHHGYRHGHDAYGVHDRPLYRRHHHGRHHGHHHSRHHHTPSASSPFQFQLVKNPYPTIVSTEELVPQQVAPHSAKHVSHSAVLAA